MKILLTFLLLGFLHHGRADVLHIKPYAQWTFDEPLEQVIYRSYSAGFPIKYTLTPDQLSYYDSLGQRESISLTSQDQVSFSPGEQHFMLVQQKESILADQAETLYSFRVYSAAGDPEYTYVHALPIDAGELEYSLTDAGSILLHEAGQPWLLEMLDEDTLLFLEQVVPVDTRGCELTLFLDRLVNPGEFVAAATCRKPWEADSSMSHDILIWSHDHLLMDPVNHPGKLTGLESIPGTDYYFLEISDGYESHLSLYSREEKIAAYPWKTWDILPLGRNAVFVISENDLNVINLGDGELITSYHPIDMPAISDAIYLANWGLYLFLRYETFYTEGGELAYRNFELEGVSKTGQIAHRSSFGTWTISLPKISQIGKDLFAIHMHNAVLLYRVELEKK